MDKLEELVEDVNDILAEYEQIVLADLAKNKNPRVLKAILIIRINGISYSKVILE